MEDRIGQQCGNYRLVKLLGQGGFAQVYLGENIHLKTRAAIKVLQTRLTAKDLEGFRSEARIIAELDHSNIIRLLDFGVRPEDGTPYLVMNYAPNGSLREHLAKNTPLPLPAVLPYIEQIAAALQYAHGQQVIHRDVKPENMLLSKTGEALLTDFGISVVARPSEKQEVIGTAPYMSPEQIQGRADVASDQYSLGVVVYEWLTGERPFRGSYIELCSQHVLAPAPPLRSKVPSIPPVVEQIVLTALAKEPQQRFRTIEAFASALKTVSQTRPGSSTLYHPVCLRCGTLLPVGGQFCSNCGFHNTAQSSLLTARGTTSDMRTPSWQFGPGTSTPIEQTPISLPLTAPSLPGGSMFSSTPPTSRTTPKPPRRRSFTLALLLLVALLIGAGVAVYFFATSSPTRCGNAGCSTPTTGVFFSDDFNDNQHNWDLRSTDPNVYSASIGGGSLTLDVNTNQTLPEIVPGPALANFTLNVDATLSTTKGSQENGYGVYIRATSSRGYLVRYYRFELYGDGTYAIYKGTERPNDETPLLARGQQPAAAIHPWGQLNHLTISAQGPHLILQVNGQKLGETLDDSSYSSGIAALFVANPTNTAQGAHVTFAHLRISSP